MTSLRAVVRPHDVTVTPGVPRTSDDVTPGFHWRLMTSLRARVPPDDVTVTTGVPLTSDDVTQGCGAA